MQVTDEEVASKIEEFIGKLKQLKEVHSPFTLVSKRESAAPSCAGGARGGSRAFLLPQIVDDPSGNSFVENPHAPRKDDALVVTHYRRTPQQAAMLGLEVMGSRCCTCLGRGAGPLPRWQTPAWERELTRLLASPLAGRGAGGEAG